MTRKDPAAVALGRKGGKARVRSQTPEQRIESASRAANARWARTEKLVREITEKSKQLFNATAKREKAMLGKTKASARRQKTQKSS
jgi:hypothetical protein